jgi:hypothetical protein
LALILHRCNSSLSLSQEVQPIDTGDAEAPIDVVRLHGIGLALDVQHFPIELNRVSALRIRFREFEQPCPLEVLTLKPA